MADNDQQKEKKNRRNGVIGTLAFHALVLLGFLFMALRTPFPPPAEEGILINFGTTETGSGLEQPETTQEEAVRETVTDPQEASEAVEEEVVMQDTEESVALEPEKTENPEPVEKKEEQPKPEPVVETKPKEPEIDPTALYKGSKSEQNKKGEEGTTDIEFGDEGVPSGDPNAANHAGDKSFGLGEEGIHADVKGRKMIFSPKINDKSQKTGKVVIRIKVDRTGKVIFVTYSQKGSTTTDSYLINLAKKAAMEARFNTDRNADIEQIGTITFRFKVK